jgi:hypothetical protein
MLVPYESWPATKPLLVIADTSHSTLFAMNVMEELTKRKLDRNTAWLTSGIRESVTSAIIVSDDERLVNHDKQTGFKFSISGGMFTRYLLQILAYSTKDLLLNEIPEMLTKAKNGQNGFKAHLCISRGVMQTLSYRSFFGGPIDSNKSVKIGGKQRSFNEIIPTGELLDDLAHFPVDPYESFLVAYTRVCLNDNNDVDEQEKGYLSEDDPIYKFLLSRDPDPPPEPVHVPSCRLARLFVKKIRRRYPFRRPMTPEERQMEKSDYIERVLECFDKWNPISGPEGRFMGE